MQPFGKKLWGFLDHGAKRSDRARKSPKVRLSFEILEDRTVPSGNASGVLSGTAFIDANGNGRFDSGEAILPGIPVSLIGTTNQGAPVNLTVSTDLSGAYSFVNVLPGTYHLQFGPSTSLLGGMPTVGNINAPAGVTLISPITLGGGQSLSNTVGFQGGLDPSAISMRLFMTDTTEADYPYGAPGAGPLLVNFRANNAPFVSSAIGTISVAKNSAPTSIDLAGHFSDPDFANSQVTFNTSAGPLTMTLFDTTAPQTVANFYDYIQSEAYNNAIFTRLETGFVLQGGGAVLNAAGNALHPTAVFPNVPSEFGASNIAGTISMALSGGTPGHPDANSGNNEFFINLADNNSGGNNLDSQKFTVFGAISSDPATQATLQNIVATPVQDQHLSAAAAALPHVNLQAVPLNNYTGTNFPSDANTSNFLVINSVSIDQRNEWLSYSVVSNSNPGLVTVSQTAEHLTLTYAHNQTGTATITVRATDRFGASVEQTFTVKVT
jgi:cyclophilin family peptidyl-prolyl cis-trans isomerase